MRTLRGRATGQVANNVMREWETKWMSPLACPVCFIFFYFLPHGGLCHSRLTVFLWWREASDLHPLPLLRRDTDKESETVRPHCEGIDVVPSQSILFISFHCDPRTRLHFALPQSLSLDAGDEAKMKRAEKFNKTHKQNTCACFRQSQFRSQC